MNRLSARQGTAAVARLRDAIRPGGLDDLPDADLLARYARYADHPAFEALLRRHGPVVFGVCRRVLPNPADAEDAFQATFLVFVRKARSVRRGDRLGPWLYGVAVRVARKARSRSAQRAVPTEATDVIPDPTTTAETPDWLPVLDAEVQALPAKYREPLILCELQGATRADAARALGIPEGTLSSRLSRGRDLLRRRLLRHGTLLPAGGVSALFTAAGVSRGAVPAGLLVRTAELAVVAATGAALAGAVPAGAARLTDEVRKGMFLTKLRVTGGAVLALGMVAAGLLAAAPVGGPMPDDQRGAVAAAPPPGAKAAPAEVPRPKGAAGKDKGGAVADLDALQGLWVLDKYEVGTARGREAGERIAKEVVGKSWFLVVGDICWGVSGSGHLPNVVKIDQTKNPKWIDMQSLAPPRRGPRCIYELSADRFRLCGVASSERRPAEFATEEEVVVMEYRREKMPPAAGDKALVGSWGTAVFEGDKRPATRVEIYDGFLFAFFPDNSTPGSGDWSKDWVGGRYTVDQTKNPKWIDIELFGRLNDESSVTKLYGCYETAEGGLALALGTTGKRSLRPLEFKEGNDVLYAPLLKVAPLAPPAAGKAKPAVAPMPAEAALSEQGERPGTGLRRVEALLATGLETVKEAQAARDERTRDALHEEAAKAFHNAAQAAGRLAGTATTSSEQGSARKVRSVAQLHYLKVLQAAGKWDKVISEADAIIRRRSGAFDTVDELVALSFAYHAFKHKNEPDRALQIRDRMKDLYGRLLPEQFPAAEGELSRAYWEKTWFPTNPKPAANHLPDPKAIEKALEATELANQLKAAADGIDEARRLVGASKVAEAEKLLREKMPRWKDAQRAAGLTLLASIVYDRGRAVVDDARRKELYAEATRLYRDAAAAVAKDKQIGSHELALARLRVAMMMQATGQWDKVLEEASPVV